MASLDERNASEKRQRCFREQDTEESTWQNKLIKTKGQQRQKTFPHPKGNQEVVMKARLEIYNTETEQWRQESIEVSSEKDVVETVEYHNSFYTEEVCSVKCEELGIDGSARIFVQDYYNSINKGDNNGI
jgi:hypothetical protein